MGFNRSPATVSGCYVKILVVSVMKLRLSFFFSFLLLACQTVDGYGHPYIIPGIPSDDIRTKALRKVLQRGLMKPDEKLLYLTHPQATADYSVQTAFLFELLDESSYMEGDIVFPYHTQHIVPPFFACLDRIMTNRQVNVEEVNKALILSLELETNNLTLYLIELGADLNDIRNAIDAFVEHAYDDSQYAFSALLRQKLRTVSK